MNNTIKFKKIKRWSLFGGFSFLGVAILLIRQSSPMILGFSKQRLAFVLMTIGICIYLIGRFIYFWSSIRYQKSKKG